MLERIVQQFFPDAAIAAIEPFGNGHINTTYKLDLKGNTDSFILQLINTDVFKDPQGIADTHARLQEAIFSGDQPLGIAELIPTVKGEKLYTDPEGGVWRMTTFIEDSYTIEVVDEAWQAMEAGNGFGWFAKACNELDATTFKESIKDFHRLSFRIWQLDEAIRENRAGRLDGIIDVVNFYKDRQETLSQIERMVDEGKIPLRVVHNDTKINNILFKGEKATAVIDLDTVGPGILYYDYGDALRTSANKAAEDEQDLAKVAFNMDAFKAFTKGYMAQVKPILSEEEANYFYLAPFLMTFIMGIRFLADYLNGDVYYKTAYIKHNIVRSSVQMKLIESMEAHEQEMKRIIEEALNPVSV